MTEPENSGREPRRRFWSRIERRSLDRMAAVVAAAFVLGYLLTALVFIRGGDRPEVVTVPDLRNQDAGPAAAAVEDLGLELIVGDSLPHPSVPRGDILAQSPLPGREVAPGSSVRVILSAGRTQGSVPDVTSLTREPATRLLTASGFRVQVTEVPDRLPSGRVIATEPQAGTRVRLPAEVRLRVSAGPPQVAVPELTGLGAEEARSALEAVGLRLGEIEYQLDELGSYEMIVGQSAAPGDSLRMGAAVHVRMLTNRPRTELP